MILDPVPTGDLIEVPYHPGHCYAAYLGSSATQVFLAPQYIKKLIISYEKVQSVTLYTKKPDNLLYHICSFHVLDLKVSVYHIYNILNKLTLTNRYVSVHL